MKKLTFIIAIVGMLFLMSCGGNESSTDSSMSKDKTENKKESEKVVEETDPMKIKGVGPIKELTLDPEIDETLVAEGKEIYEKMCTACHKLEKRFIGPAPAGIMDRRSPEWIMNMILNPEVMVKEDPIAKELMAEYLSPMSNQNLTEEEARAILEYFRTL